MRKAQFPIPPPQPVFLGVYFKDAPGPEHMGEKWSRRLYILSLKAPRNLWPPLFKSQLFHQLKTLQPSWPFLYKIRRQKTNRVYSKIVINVFSFLVKDLFFATFCNSLKGSAIPNFQRNRTFPPPTKGWSLLYSVTQSLIFNLQDSSRSTFIWLQRNELGERLWERFSVSACLSFVQTFFSAGLSLLCGS